MGLIDDIKNSEFKDYYDLTRRDYGRLLVSRKGLEIIESSEKKTQNLFDHFYLHSEWTKIWHDLHDRYVRGTISEDEEVLLKKADDFIEPKENFVGRGSEGDVYKYFFPKSIFF